MKDQITNITAQPISAMTKGLFAAGAALFAMTLAPVANAHGGDGFTINGFNFGDDTEDLLEKLIELDADEIEEIRIDLADAREDVLDAISDVEEAKEEASDVPGGGAIVKIAIGIAAGAVVESTDEIFEELRVSLNDASKELVERRSEVGEAEFDETNNAISVMLSGIAGIEDAIDTLVAAMRDEA
ncbi:MAG: hypothetical protein HKN14_02025 [Marinicaulis sp.]|nr:hypothetical protein [Marinicaulis sp.]NNE39676.1 hypothetical protein [Marinicaulis sp.]NNL90424.1 hypothetical protein [Marinicaulis sp.]